MKLKLTKEQIKIRAFGEEFNQKAREVETAQDLLDLVPLNKQQNFILMRENE